MSVQVPSVPTGVAATAQTHATAIAAQFIVPQVAVVSHGFAVTSQTHSVSAAVQAHAIQVVATVG